MCCWGRFTYLWLRFSLSEFTVGFVVCHWHQLLLSHISWSTFFTPTSVITALAWNSVNFNGCLLLHPLALVNVLMQATRWSGSCWRCRCWKTMTSWHTRRLRRRLPCRGRPTADLDGCAYSLVICWSGRKCCRRCVHVLSSSVASTACRQLRLTYWHKLA